MASAGEKSLAVGHIPGFQIDPNENLWFFRFCCFFVKMKKRRKPLILLGFPAELLAFPRWFEHPTYRLGGGRSIQLSYGNIFKIYSIMDLN